MDLHYLFVVGDHPGILECIHEAADEVVDVAAFQVLGSGVVDHWVQLEVGVVRCEHDPHRKRDVIRCLRDELGSTQQLGHLFLPSHVRARHEGASLRHPGTGLALSSEGHVEQPFER